MSAHFLAGLPLDACYNSGQETSSVAEGARVGKPKRGPTATNTVHFACFDCRKAFKQPGSSNWDPEVPARPFPCPECKQPMARLGRYFKAPPQRASRQWLKVELLHYYGEQFESGYLGLGRKCRTLPDTIAYLAGPGRPASEVRAVLEGIRVSRARAARQGEPAAAYGGRDPEFSEFTVARRGRRI